MFTFVVVGCERDLALLELQAQSMKRYLPVGQEIILLVNEKDPYKFLNGLKSFEQCYEGFKLQIKTLDDLGIVANQPYVDQQILKLAAAELTDNHLIVLDCQNFLFKPYVALPVLDDKIPYRRAPYAMNPLIWDEYCEKLGNKLPLNLHNMCLSTPIYLRSDVIRHMIKHFGGLQDFAKWFYTATRSKSEFALYLQWCERLQGLEHFHYLESDFFDWAGPYLRDHPNFDEIFNDYLLQLKIRMDYQGHPKSNDVLRHFKPKCSWSSINHRAWGNMTDEQFDRLTTLLNEVKLDTKCLIDYRTNYVHVPI